MKFVSFSYQTIAMSNRLSIVVLLMSSLLSLASSCKDENKPPTPTYCQQSGTCETVMEAKQYFAFKMGSWWVYEEETTHERDSVYVIEYANDEASPNFDVTLFSERENMRYHYFPQIVVTNGCSDYDQINERKCIYIRRSKGNFGNYIGESICFFTQHRVGATQAIVNPVNWNDKIHVQDIQLDYTLGDLTFGRTVKIYEDNNVSEHQQPTNHYFSKGVGLIRKELLDSNQVWNLVSYHIEP